MRLLNYDEFRKQWATDLIKSLGVDGGDDLERFANAWGAAGNHIKDCPGVTEDDKAQWGGRIKTLLEDEIPLDDIDVFFDSLVDVIKHIVHCKGI